MNPENRIFCRRFVNKTLKRPYFSSEEALLPHLEMSGYIRGKYTNYSDGARCISVISNMQSPLGA